MQIDFRTTPENYKHWSLKCDGPVAYLTLDVDETAGLFDGYELKLNSYDLGVDIELNDALQRLRFEHPEVGALVVQSGKDRVFCAGANIRMLAGSTHSHKVNFCKFTNETRNGMEDMSLHSGIKSICAINGTAAGGGYELALACDHITLTDDGAAAVSLPEVPLLAVLPGTGGLTRVTDKRKVRRDLADVFCTVEEGIKGQRAKDWRLVDEVPANSKFAETITERAAEFASASKRPGSGKGVKLLPLEREIGDMHVSYSHVAIEIENESRLATITIKGPSELPPENADAAVEQGVEFWPLTVSRELEDAILHLRFNAPDLALLQFKTIGESDKVLAYDTFIDAHSSHWLINEVRQYLKRTLKRVDMTSRSLVTLVEPGSCFAGTLAELAFAADRCYMLIGQFEGDNRPEATLHLSAMNFGPYPMANELTRLQNRFFGTPEKVAELEALSGEAIDAERADELGLVTFAYDDIDWEDEVRIFMEERASFSPDGLTGMEANLRFAGPETMECRIFGRLTAWQNWIFQRPNAAGPEGALRRYGSGQRPVYDTTRV